jgi:signal transduction histidine kinase
MPEFDALRALAALKESGVDVPFIVLSGTVSEENAVDALRAGADDFISKGKLARLLPAIDRELREAQVRKERKVLEDRLLQAQKLEAIGSLAGGVAHDFNNLLGIITSYAELLEQAITDKDMLDDLREIQNAAERAAALTKQLLAFSRKQVLNPVVVCPNQLVVEIEKLLGRVIGRGVRVKSRLGDDVGDVKVDRGQLDQVLINLVVNARDAMPHGGTVTIETANVELDDTLDGIPIVPGSFIAISVIDTGTGMAPQTQARLFEPFFTTKEPGKGTGLGLATVHGIVKQSGGYVAVRSTPGEGTTFTVYLPRVGDFESAEVLSGVRDQDVHAMTGASGS